jgi:hypothetical protein
MHTWQLPSNRWLLGLLAVACRRATVLSAPLSRASRARGPRLRHRDCTGVLPQPGELTAVYRFQPLTHQGAHVVAELNQTNKVATNTRKTTATTAAPPLVR